MTLASLPFPLRPAPPTLRVLAIAVCVLLGHALLLQGPWRAPSLAPPPVWPARLLVQLPEPVPSEGARPDPVRAAPQANRPLPHPVSAAAVTQPRAQPATRVVVGPAPASGPQPQDGASAVPALPAAPPPPPSTSESNTPLASSGALARAPARFPDSVRLEFEGRGKEKGLISYSGSAELLWSRQPDRYESRLDISALGFRLVTWTSKGALNAAGLEPVRFGDRRRGPEVAAHFQRDKGVISFSTNRPDVPLQAGAQDKLSALLQLTALVGASPQTYPAGSKIVFQAADAYRAEPWEFEAGAPEKMELPGGTLTVIGFVKNPTVEFDQKIEVWLAADQAYLPVRLRITEPSGTFSDLLWRKTAKLE